MIRIALLCLALLTPQIPLAATSPDEILQDPALEERARSLGKELRCLVCQNQSIDDSDAPLARDLRLIVRERLTAGESDEDIKTYLVERYGDFVLLKPPFNSGTLALWIGPFIILGLGAIGTAIFLKNRTQIVQSDVAEDEAYDRAAAAEILGTNPEKDKTATS